MVAVVSKVSAERRERFAGGVRVVADDLTGACDAAAAFLGWGGVRVWLGATVPYGVAEMVQAFNTRSRDLSASEAEAAVRASVHCFAEREDVLAFKKIDSCMRGNVVEETIAAREAFGARTLVVTPAFPAAGRTVRGGVLRIEDAAGSRTVDLCAAFGADAVSVGDAQRLFQEVEAHRAGVVICDAGTQAELVAVAECPVRDVMFAGSAGLAYALAGGSPSGAKAPFEGLGDRGLKPPSPSVKSNDNSNDKSNDKSNDNSRFPSGMTNKEGNDNNNDNGNGNGNGNGECEGSDGVGVGTVLTVCGTPHAVTARQVELLLAEMPGAEVLQIAAEAEDAAVILSEFERVKPTALVLTGGDTALLVLETLGADSILLKGECAPGIPWGVVQSGVAHGCVVVTKSGGFGEERSLVKIVKALEGEA